MVELYEKGALRDTHIACVYVGVPGLGGGPHVDPKSVPYQFTSQVGVVCVTPSHEACSPCIV